MKGFNFEKNLTHQTRAVESTIAVFENLKLKEALAIDKNYINPEFDFLSDLNYAGNIRKSQGNNHIELNADIKSNIIDIMMETGTGKTYTYTKTIFELNKNFGIFKFIILVPTLSIKAGTVDFLKSESSREHFKKDYNKTINLHILESQKKNKAKKSYIPSAISSFVNAGNYEKNSIQVLIINSGMLNSDTLKKSFDKEIFDKYIVPVDAISATRPFMVMDEPHKYDTKNKAWENIKLLNPQFILRYGATFPEKEIKSKDIFTDKIVKKQVKDYHNLIYQLTAVDSFKDNLVKGVIGYIAEIGDNKDAIVKFIDSDGSEASFELIEKSKSKIVKLTKSASMSAIHPEMKDLVIDSLNKSIVVLSNGLELKKGDKLNPYSYAEKLQETMIQQAIRQHFIIEKQLLTREIKIKPITLFFIDNIEEYRGANGYLRNITERYIKAEIEELLQTETNDFYRAYLEKTLTDLSKSHAGYFSQDNSEKDEQIEKEINEILHDKQSMLSLDNPRRFIFSKWTLREGWDNPNVFQICKLRSSGSEISKLQEVGRGLRLPVNEYGNRVKDEQFYLNYFVDFTESDFVDKLVNEINQKSGALSVEDNFDGLTSQMIKIICEKYDSTEEELLDYLDKNNVITRSNKFKEGGYDYIKEVFPMIFQGVDSNKIRKATDVKKNVTIRIEKYQELKELWEKINEKVILEYKFDDENHFKQLFTQFLQDVQNQLIVEGINLNSSQIVFEDGAAYSKNIGSVENRMLKRFSTMKYSDFLKELAAALKVNLITLHRSLIEANVNINDSLNSKTIRNLKQKFDFFLMQNAISNFAIEYKRISNNIHPTKLTNVDGSPIESLGAGNIGLLYSNDKVADSYYFNDLFYDSPLEKKNIQDEIEEVVVFTKIPKNSIKIPVSGGATYSPDFAYVVKMKNGEKKLHFIIETKDIDDSNFLRDEEKFKIKHAEKFFGGQLKIKFVSQFKQDEITQLIKNNLVA